MGNLLSSFYYYGWIGNTPEMETKFDSSDEERDDLKDWLSMPFGVMNLVTDDDSGSRQPGETNLSILTKIEERLDPQDRFSMVFLLYDNPHIALHYLQRESRSRRMYYTNGPVLDSSCFREGTYFSSSENENDGLLTAWAKGSSTSFWEMLTEALLIIKNYQCLKLLEPNFERRKNLELDYLPEHYHIAVCIDHVRKLLYMLVDDLKINEWEKLMHLMDAEGPQVDTVFTFSQRKRYPEISLLLWISNGLIQVKNTPDGSVDFTPLVQNLKKLKFTIWADRVGEVQKFLNSTQEQDAPLKHDDDHDHLSLDSFNLKPDDQGTIMIINQEKFNGAKGQNGIVLEDRKGTNFDCKRLQETFELLSFKVLVMENLKAAEIVSCLEQAVKEFCLKTTGEFQRCFIVAILSHGHRGIIYGTDGITVKLDKIRYILRDGQLEGLPRIIILQACQGVSQVKEKNGIPVVTDGPNGPNGGAAISCHNLYEFSSSVPDFVAYRSESLGSFFIHELCDFILRYGGEHHFHDLVIGITNKLSKMDVKHNGVRILITPQQTGTLTKQLKFIVPNLAEYKKRYNLAYLVEHKKRHNMANPSGERSTRNEPSTSPHYSYSDILASAKRNLEEDKR